MARRRLPGDDDPRARVTVAIETEMSEVELPKRESLRDLVLRAYAAFNARDLDSALAALHPNVDWPNAIDGGRVQGHDEIRRYWMRQFEFLDPRVEPQAVSEDEHGRVIVDVRQVVRDLDGALIADERVTHVYALRDRLIARMDIQEWSVDEVRG
jgi:hypothetical protein